MLNTILLVAAVLLLIYVAFKKIFPDVAPHIPGVWLWSYALNPTKFKSYLTAKAIKNGGPFIKVQSNRTAIVVTQPESAKVTHSNIANIQNNLLIYFLIIVDAL